MPTTNGVTIAIAAGPRGDTGASPQFRTRLGTPEDHNFVFATWLRSYRHSSQFARRITDAVFYRQHQAAIARILERGAELLICSPADDETILGYVVRERGVLHFAYVKKPFRRLGIASGLLVEPPELFTHWTADWDLARGKLAPLAQYNPYLI